MGTPTPSSGTGGSGGGAGGVGTPTPSSGTGGSGGVIASVGEEIFIISGTTTNDMTTGTILNTVSRLAPGIGQNGSKQTQYLTPYGSFDKLHG
ncbi:hypothetical protein [Leptospira sp. mild_001]|uniref:hypothetical protein n=1 Tax=Leptospira sp. mild_001 TaxID=2838238 RepID=UPI001E496A06|nr:hypothetical protein [Leptospira sp. mild_001]